MYTLYSNRNITWKLQHLRQILATDTSPPEKSTQHQGPGTGDLEVDAKREREEGGRDAEQQGGTGHTDIPSEKTINGEEERGWVVQWGTAQWILFVSPAAAACSSIAMLTMEEWKFDGPVLAVAVGANWD